MIIQKLQKLGLSEKEVKVYLATLELGGESAPKIAKKSGVNHATTYVCLTVLETKGLVSELPRGKKRNFVAEHPEKLLANILNSEQDLKNKEQELRSILPELTALFNFSPLKPKVKFFEGFEGLKEVYEDTLLLGQEILAFVSISSPDRNFRRWLENEYVAHRVKKKIKAYVIAPADAEAKNYQAKDNLEYRETKLIDPKKYPLSIEVDIYNNKVALMSYGTKEMFGVIIESQEVYKTMKHIFHLVWNT